MIGPTHPEYERLARESAAATIRQHAADQPTTEPSEGIVLTTARDLDALPVGSIVKSHDEGDLWERLTNGWTNGSIFFEKGAGLSPATVRHLPAPQPAADADVADVVQGEVWRWLNRHDAPWSPSDAKVLDLALAIRSALAPQPAADTETEVQWGLRFESVDGTTVEHKLSGEREARFLAPRMPGVVLRRTGPDTPWEEA